MADQQLKNLTATTTPSDTDILYTVVDPAGTPLDRKITWTTIKAFFKTYFDTLYAPVLGADDNYVTDAEKIVIGNTSGTNSGDNATNSQYSGLASSKQDHTTALDNVTGVNSGDETATRIGALIGGSDDATPNDTDFVATSLTGGGILKKITWTNVKSFLKTYFDGLYATTAQGTLATNALPKGGGTMTGKIVKAGATEIAKTYTLGSGFWPVVIDASVNNMHIVIGNDSGTAIVFGITGMTENQPIVISILQGAVVSTIESWFATIRWAGGTAPTLTATVGKRDTFGFIRTGTDTYDGFIIGQNC